MTERPTKAEADRDAWLDDIYREAKANIAFLIGINTALAVSLYGHLVEAEAEAIERAAQDEDYGYEWDRLQEERNRLPSTPSKVSSGPAGMRGA